MSASASLPRPSAAPRDSAARRLPLSISLPMKRHLFRALAAPALGCALLGSPSLAQWSFESLPTPRSSICMAALNGKVYFAGGQDAGGNWVDTIDVFDEATGGWSSLSLPAPFIRGRAAAVGQSVFFGAAWEGPPPTINNRVYEYDTLSGTWTTHTMSIERYETAFAAVGPYLVIAGGLDAGFGATDVVDIYDSLSGSWSSLSLPTAVDAPAFAVSGGRLWLAGGEDTATIPVDDMQFVDPAAGITGSISDLATSRGRLVGGATGKRSWFLGGVDAGFQPLDAWDAVDTDPFAQSAGQLPQAVYGAAAAHAGNRLIVAGGLDPVTFTPLSDAVVIEVDGTATGTTIPGQGPMIPSFTLLGFHVGASTARSAYFAGGLDASFAPTGTVVVYTNPDALCIDTSSVSLSAGSLSTLDIQVDASLAGTTYLVLGSFSGTSPGFPIGGGLNLPLNLDGYTTTMLVAPNSIPHLNTLNVVGADGSAQAQLFLPPGINPALAGITASYAALFIDFLGLQVADVTNAASVTFTP